MIREEVLLTYGGTFRKYKKGQCIFFESDKPLFYYQVCEGSVRVVNIFTDGKEFIQGMFKKEESFGEYVLLIDSLYPATAICNEDTMVLKIKKENFLYLLQNNNDILFDLTRLLSSRLVRNVTIAKEISGEKPIHRIATLLSMFKKESTCSNEQPFKIDLSRQRIADMVGLRVETVIRVMKKLEEDGLISIRNGKAYV